MVRRILTLFFLLAAFALQARQVYTIRPGNWEADSVWYNNMKPDTTGDTISIFHHINLNSDIVVSTSSYLFIDTSGWLCGDHSLLLTGWAHFFNLGFLGLYYFEMYQATGLNIAPGVIDLGTRGMYMHGIGSHFKDSLGCMKVHTGRQQCLYPCVLDTFLNVTANLNIINLETHEQPVWYEYDFGDGTSFSTSENHATHTYSDSGEFEIRLIISSCCGRDTVYRKIYIELPPPPCVDNNFYIIYPNPTDEGFWIKKEFCGDEEVSVKIYTVLGQITGTYLFTTVEKVLKEYISCYLLSAGTYIVQAASPSKTQKLKLVLVDDY